LIEKLVVRPRHIEVQVFGDSHGHVVHLFERDCSLQRRRQKVIEEAPAPGMTDTVRAAMTDAAGKLARAVNYQSAGTVEFIVDGTGPLREDGFWFLEMNTRLQVEHPVTEKITGLDLVEWQFRVAAGEPLPLAQDEITMSGHAIEARICAEDPAENFRPSVGRIATMVLHPSPDMRYDVGFDAGDHVSPFYDSMIGKAIVHAHDRDVALASMAAMAADACIDGPVMNTALIAALMRHPKVQEGVMDVGMIEREMDYLTYDANKDRAPPVLALAHALGAKALASNNAPWSALDGFRLNAPAHIAIGFDDGETPRWLRVIDLDGGHLVSSEAHQWRAEWACLHRGQTVSLVTARLDDVDVRAWISAPANGWRVFLDGRCYRFACYGASAEMHAGAGGDDIIAPLPGKIVALVAKSGDTVKKGDAILTLEAMKMEHALKAPRDGMIAQITAAVGDQVKEGAVLVRLAAAG
jgi:3-methylcrotonyl-CoA carboxylase alpha subunit